MRPVPVGCKPGAQAETGSTTCNNVQYPGSNDCAEDLNRYVRDYVARRKTPTCGETECDCGVDMASADVPDRKRHSQQRQAKRQCYPEQAHAHVRKGRRQNGRTASAQY